MICYNTPKIIFTQFKKRIDFFPVFIKTRCKYKKYVLL